MEKVHVISEIEVIVTEAGGDMDSTIFLAVFACESDAHANHIGGYAQMRRFASLRQQLLGSLHKLYKLLTREQKLGGVNGIELDLACVCIAMLESDQGNHGWHRDTQRLGEGSLALWFAFTELVIDFVAIVRLWAPEDVDFAVDVVQLKVESLCARALSVRSSCFSMVESV